MLHLHIADSRLGVVLKLLAHIPEKKKQCAQGHGVTLHNSHNNDKKDTGAEPAQGFSQQSTQTKNELFQIRSQRDGVEASGQVVTELLDEVSNVTQ